MDATARFFEVDGRLGCLDGTVDGRGVEGRQGQGRSRRRAAAPASSPCLLLARLRGKDCAEKTGFFTAHRTARMTKPRVGGPVGGKSTPAGASPLPLSPATLTSHRYRLAYPLVPGPQLLPQMPTLEELPDDPFVCSTRPSPQRRRLGIRPATISSRSVLTTRTPFNLAARCLCRR